MKRPQESAAVAAQPDKSPNAEAGVVEEPSSAFLTQCYRSALERLNVAFEKRQPLAIVIGQGKAASSFVLKTFLNELDDTVAAARISTPCEDAQDLMRRVISAAGFFPKDLSTNDLETIFSMFLAYQKGHGYRTVICIEELQDSEWWVFDKIRRLIEMEVGGRYGLMLIISGQPTMQELLNTRPLSAVTSHAGKRISLAPFTLEETTEYVRRRVEAAGTSRIDHVFEYQAITLIHDLCSGVPDAISSLVSRSLELADEHGISKISTTVVKTAYESLRYPADRRREIDHTSTLAVDRVDVHYGRLVCRLDGKELEKKALRQGHLLIGRSKLCDIRVDSPIVSRHHALITYDDGHATIADLGSTNGTSVNGYEVREHELVNGDTIQIGECEIKYEAGDDRRSGQTDTEQVEIRPTV
jgi:type II secretory pathway predicted ATPase ExeA